MNGHAVETMSHLTDSGVKEMAHEEDLLHDIDASKLTVTLSSTKRPVPEPNSAEVWSVKACTDHSKSSPHQSSTVSGTIRSIGYLHIPVVKIKWTDDYGWYEPVIVPYGPLEIMPTASCLHYGTCFPHSAPKTSHILTQDQQHNALKA